MKHVALGDILKVMPQQVQERLLSIVNWPVERDDLDVIAELKATLAPHQAALATVDVIPDYLAYVLLHVRQQHVVKQVTGLAQAGGNPELN